MNFPQARPEKLTILPCGSRIVDVIPFSKIKDLKEISNDSIEENRDLVYLGPGRLVPKCIVNGSIDEYPQYAGHDRQGSK